MADGNVFSLPPRVEPPQARPGVFAPFSTIPGNIIPDQQQVFSGQDLGVNAGPPTSVGDREARKAGWKSFFVNAMEDPDFQQTLLRFGAKLLQPRPADQSTLGQISEALFESGEFLTQRKAGRRKEEREEERLGLARRQVGIAEEGLEERKRAGERARDIAGAREAREAAREPLELKKLQAEIDRLGKPTGKATEKDKLAQALQNKAGLDSDAALIAANLFDSKGGFDAGQYAGVRFKDIQRDPLSEVTLEEASLKVAEEIAVLDKLEGETLEKVLRKSVIEAVKGDEKKKDPLSSLTPEQLLQTLRDTFPDVPFIEADALADINTPEGRKQVEAAIRRARSGK